MSGGVSGTYERARIRMASFCRRLRVDPGSVEHYHLIERVECSRRSGYRVIVRREQDRVVLRDFVIDVGD